jgi:hypothetical protein
MKTRGQGGLGDVEALGSPADAVESGDLEKALDVYQEHRQPL